MPRPHRARGVALAALLTLARASRVAADVAVRDFAQTGTSWTFQGVAAPAKSSEASDAHALRVTPARANAAGSAFATSKQLVGGGFVAEFAFAITTPANVEVPCEGVDHAPATCSPLSLRTMPTRPPSPRASAASTTLRAGSGAVARPCQIARAWWLASR